MGLSQMWRYEPFRTAGYSDKNSERNTKKRYEKQHNGEYFNDWDRGIAVLKKKSCY